MRTPLFDHVILASDFSPKFLNFWPLAAISWEKDFSVRPTLALVYGNQHIDRVMATMPSLERYGEVVLLEGSTRAPLGNQAKLARYFVASRYSGKFVCTVDIDTIHLTNRHLSEKFEATSRQKFVAMGAEAYEGTPHEGNFPAGIFAGPGQLFSQLFNIGGKTFAEFVDSLIGNFVYSPKEDPSIRRRYFFSDEYLIKALLSTSELQTQVQHVRRDIEPREAWLDRSWWPSRKKLREERDNYILVNFPRPYLENRTRIDSALGELGFPVPKRVPLNDFLLFWNFREAFSAFRLWSREYFEKKSS